MTFPDVLNAPRLNLDQKGDESRHSDGVSSFYSPALRLCYSEASLETAVSSLSVRLVWEIENPFTADCLLSFFPPQRGSDELSMYNSPNSGMSSISGEFVPTTPDEGRGLVEFAWRRPK